MALVAVNTAAPRASSAADDIAFAFPTIDPGVVPAGSRVLLQLRRPLKKTKGGIILPADTRETELYNTQVAKVVAMGPGAYRHRASGDPWYEGVWCEVGDFVRVSKFGGDRFTVKLEDPSVQQIGTPVEDQITFVILMDHDILARVAGDPLAITAYL